MPKKSRQPPVSPPLLLRTPEVQAFYEEAYKTFSEARDLEGLRLLYRVIRKLAGHHFGPTFVVTLRTKREATRADIRQELLRNFPIPLDELFRAMLLLYSLYRVDDRVFENEMRREFGYLPLPRGTNLDWLVKRMKHLDNFILWNMQTGHLTLEVLWNAVARLRQGIPLNLNLQGWGRRRVPPGETLLKEYAEIVQGAMPLLQVCRDLDVEPGQDEQVAAAFPGVANEHGVPRYPGRFTDHLLAKKYGVKPETIKKARQRASRHRSRR